MGKDTVRFLLKTGSSDFHHEKYRRKIEPLGTTAISVSLANKLLETI